MNENLKKQITTLPMLPVNSLEKAVVAVSTDIDREQEKNMPNADHIQMASAFRSALLSHLICSAKLEEANNKLVNQRITELTTEGNEP